MSELIIVTYDPGKPHANHYVVEPTGDSHVGCHIGSIYIAGEIRGKFNTHDEAVQAVIQHSK